MGTLLVKVHPVDVEIIDDDRVAAAVRRNGQFEPQSLDAWGAICADGKAKLVFDVGSYGGLFGIAAALMKNKVVAFEPKPIMVRRTKANMALNGVEFEVVQAAVSDEDGKAQLGFNPNLALTSGSSLEMKGAATMTVRTVRLDSRVFLAGERIGAIKIDVEGHEAAVLRGGADMIAKHKPFILIETLDNDKRKEEVKAALPGYTVKAFLDKRNLFMVPT